MKELELFTPKDRTARQHECLTKWVKNKCKGSIEAATGFGKTRVGLNAISAVHKHYPELKVIVVVPTDVLQIQWEEQLKERGLQDIATVKIINTIIKHDWVCSVLVLDEIHRYNSDMFSLIFKKVKYNYILGLTATFERLDGKHILMEQKCPVIDSISLGEALLSGWVSKFTEYQVLIDVDDIHIYDEYQKKFNEDYEFFGWNFPLAMSMAGSKGYINQIDYRDKLVGLHADQATKSNMLKAIKNHSASFMRNLTARKKFINNHPKKLELARKIINARSNAKIITFSNNVAMAEAIGVGNVYTGKMSKKKGRITIDEFNAKDTGILNTCAKANEGLDIKGLSVAIIIGLDSSKTKAVQRTGRVIRFEPGKTAEIFTIVINGSVETQWFKNSHKDSDYVTIDEKNLEKVLNGEPYETYKKPVQNLAFRF